MEPQQQDHQQQQNTTNLKKSVSRPELMSSQLSLALEKNKPSIPDGGWGWVVVFATFAVYGIAEGVSFVFGLLFIEFLHEFGASKSATSWIGSLFMALPLIAGPVCSALVDKYGCRKMTILGSIVCSLGFVLSSYAQSIGMLYVTFGIIGGFARGLVYVTAVVSVAFWFEKKRSLALGISASGTGVGTVVCAPITAYLLFEFGWRGTVLILAGLLANMCVCGALMIDPKWVKDEEKENKKKNKLEKEKRQAVANEMKVLLENKENGMGTTVAPPKRHWATRFPALFKFTDSFSMFLEVHFLFLSLGILIAAAWFLIPFFYLADHMVANSYTEDEASFVLSAIGFTNTLGMIFLGWLAKYINTAKIFGISLILCGLSIWCIMFFTANYILLIISSGSFGFFFASCFALSPALLSELIPLDDFTMGYGLILLAEGLGHLMGPPIAGFLTDLTKSWSTAFYQAGLWVMIAGVLIVTIAFTKNRGLFGHKLAEQKNSQTNDNKV